MDKLIPAQFNFRGGRENRRQKEEKQPGNENQRVNNKLSPVFLKDLKSSCNFLQYAAYRKAHYIIKVSFN